VWSLPPRSLPRPSYYDGDMGGPSRRRRVFGAALGWSTCRLLPLPCCIINAMNCLVRSAPDAVGIFRKSGVRSRIQKLRDDIEARPGLQRVHCVSACARSIVQYRSTLGCTASDLRSTGRGFKSYSGQSCVTTLGKLFTPMCLCHQAV